MFSKCMWRWFDHCTSIIFSFFLLLLSEVYLISTSSPGVGSTLIFFFKILCNHILPFMLRSTGHPFSVSCFNVISVSAVTVYRMSKYGECAADRFYPSSIRVKNMWSYASTPSCIHGVILN